MPQKYSVTYIVVPSIASRRQYRQHRIFFTDDIESILIGIIPTRRRTGRGKIKAHLREYREKGRVTFGRADNLGMIKDIAIRKLPEHDYQVLQKYL